jgi:hypothetical protein
LLRKPLETELKDDALIYEAQSNPEVLGVLQATAPGS